MQSSRGFSILEVLVVVALVFVVTGFAILGWNGIWFNYRVNAATSEVVSQFRTGREMAISKRRSVEIAFILPNQIQLTPDNPNGTPVSPNPNPVVTLEGGSQFLVFPGVPDSPMASGNTSALSFNAAGIAPVPPMRFTSSGALVDANNNFVNGTVFLGLPGKASTARAITILGATGRVRAYFWNGQQWIE